MKVAVVASAETLALLEGKFPEVRFSVLRAGRMRRELLGVGLNGLMLAPAEASADEMDDVCCVADFISVPVVLLGELKNSGAGFVTLLTRSGNPRLRLDLYDDEKKLKMFLQESSPWREQAAYIDALRQCTDRISARASSAVVRGLVEYPVAGWVRRAAHRSGFSERTFRDKVHGCGVRDARLIFWGSRTIDAAGFARDPAFPRAAIARKCGYAGADSLLWSLHHLGITDLAELAALSGDDVLRRVLGVVLDPGAVDR